MSKSLIWSWSTSRMFQKCKRQWYIKAFVASHNARDDRRREAYLLSRLQSISAWRGNLVDFVITKKIVPAIKNHQPIELSEAIEYARFHFNSQWEYALHNNLRQEDFARSKEGDTFAAFHPVEYGLKIQPDEREKAWEDVERSLAHFFGMDELLLTLRTATQLFAQNPLIFQLFDVKIRSVPDLIAFYYDAPPTIIDWKVSIFAANDYRPQLGTYALALIRSGDRSDFPSSLSLYKPTDIRLLEAQLLFGQLREYSLTDPDIEEIETYIVNTASQMNLALGEEPDRGQIRPFDFPVTSNPGLCERCNFKSLCWQEKVLWAEWKQMSFL